MICGNRQQKPDAVTKGVHTLIDTNDESRDRDNRWSMSTDQHPQQLVTSVKQDRNVGSTVVNMHDIDKCRATNKHERSTQHSIQASNQWLFSAFSKLTSNVLGKSKNTLREEFMENINTKCNLNPAFKPEFNFFL